jgi:hypothetical protein
VVLVARECERSATEDVLLRAAFTHATVVAGCTALLNLWTLKEYGCEREGGREEGEK